MAMVVEVSRLNGVHRAHHGNAERNHREVGEPVPEAEGVMIGVVDLSQAGQKEEERAQQCHAREALMAGFSEVPA